MADKMSVLIVEDDPGVLDKYVNDLKCFDYDTTGIFYRGPQTEIPSRKFRRAVVDGLNGDWKLVVEKIDAEKIIVLSGDSDIVEEAESQGHLARGKANMLINALAEMLK